MHIFDRFKRIKAQARNDMGERIQSLRFTVPALRVGVLEYAPGQLTTSNTALDGKTVKLYYPPEAVSEEKFLKSLETAPVVVGGHDTTTNEQNKKIDGWAHTVYYDDVAKAAMIKGVVKGNKEVAYIKSNLGQDDFGASAFVDIHNMEIKDGVTPDGQTYNAIATELKATHVALAQHVRDPENKIEVTNAVVVNTSGNYSADTACENNKKEEAMNMDEKQLAAIVANTVKEVLAENEEGAELDEMKKAISEIKAALETLAKASGSETTKRKEEVVNEDPEKKKDGEEEKDGESATLENAKPSQALIGVVGTALNIDFGKKTPSFKSLAGLLGIKDEDPCARIAAVNAKVAELGAAKKKETSTAANTVEVF